MRLDKDQVFLLDEDILNKIVSLANLEADDVVLEIGAGEGNLTKKLAERVKKVYAIEEDSGLARKLRQTFEGWDNVTVIVGNALKIKFPSFNKSVSNLPYSILEPLFRKLTKYDFDYCIFLVPSKFYYRLIAKEGEALFSRLSVFANLFYKIEYLDKVAKEAFYPKAKREGIIIKLSLKQSVDLGEEVLKELFRQDDKKLKNALREGLIKAFNKFGSTLTKRQARDIIERLGIDSFLLDKKVSEFSTEDFLSVIKKIKSFLDNHTA